MKTNRQSAIVTALVPCVLDSFVLRLAGRRPARFRYAARPPQQRPMAIVNATLHPDERCGDREWHDRVRRRKDPAGRAGISVPAGAETIDGQGKHVFPGLFDASTQLGLIEIESVRATLDMSESGALNPNAEALKAVNPDSELIPVARSNGVLIAQSLLTVGC